MPRVWPHFVFITLPTATTDSCVQGGGGALRPTAGTLGGTHEFWSRHNIAILPLDLLAGADDDETVTPLRDCGGVCSCSCRERGFAKDSKEDTSAHLSPTNAALPC